MKWPDARKRLPENAPNILVVLLDDVGFGIADTFGGEVHTPTLTKLANEGIRVNAVRPGLIETEIHASGGDENRVKRLLPKVPMQRGGSAQEVAEAILWLASDKASYTTGSFIEVSGGR